MLCLLCRLSRMLSVLNLPFMPSVIMLGVVMVSVVALDLLNENVLAVADLANILNFLVGEKITFFVGHG